MRANPLRRLPRFIAAALTAAAATSLAACGNVTGPQDQQARRAPVERVQLLDGDTSCVSVCRGPTIPWY